MKRPLVESTTMWHPEKMIIYGGVVALYSWLCLQPSWPCLAAARSCSFLQSFLSLIWTAGSPECCSGTLRARGQTPSIANGPAKPGLLPVLHQPHWYAFVALNTEVMWRLFEWPFGLISQDCRWAAVGSRAGCSCSGAVFGCGVEYFQ